MSWFAVIEDPEASQTSRVRTAAVSSAGTTDVTLCRGVAREMIRAQRINMLMFLMFTNVVKIRRAVNFKILVNSKQKRKRKQRDRIY